MNRSDGREFDWSIEDRKVDQVVHPCGIPVLSAALHLTVRTGLPECDVISLLRRTGVNRLTSADWGLKLVVGILNNLQNPLGDLTDRSDEGPDPLGQTKVVRLQIVFSDNPLRN